MKLNLYKIDSYFEKTAKDEISEKDYNLLGSEYVEGVKYELFINQKNRNSIKWLESMKSVFNVKKDLDDIGSIYNGIILITFKDEKQYALTFGYGYHAIQNICDPNFALDFAEREIQYSNIELKSSNFIQSSKIKELTNLRKNSPFMNEAGESFNFISGTPLNSELFGSKVECSNSIRCSKLFEFKKIDDLGNVGRYIKQIESVINKEKTINTFPRVRYLKRNHNLNVKLDKQLIKMLEENEYCLDINLAAFDILGNHIQLYGNQYTYEL